MSQCKEFLNQVIEASFVYPNSERQEIELLIPFFGNNEVQQFMQQSVVQDWFNNPVLSTDTINQVIKRIRLYFISPCEEVRPFIESNFNDQQRDSLGCICDAIEDNLNFHDGAQLQQIVINTKTKLLVWGLQTLLSDQTDFSIKMRSEAFQFLMAKSLVVVLADALNQQSHPVTRKYSFN